MRLVRCEWRKLFRLPALWAFFALCLAFNVLLIFENDYGRDYFNDASRLTGELGQRVDESFLEKCVAHIGSENQRQLLETAAGMENIFETTRTDDLSRFYQNIVEKSKLAVSWMAWKYELLQGRVDHLSETGAAMDLYAGEMTFRSHQFLFGSLLRAVLMEGILLGMLSALFLCGCERLSGTEAGVSVTRAGRRLWRSKLLAAVSGAVALYLLLAISTLLVYFSLWGYSGLWTASVSSQFNYYLDMMYLRPFLTWGDFTVAGYLVAHLALGAAVTVVFTLMGNAFGLLVRNTYAAALALGVVCFGSLIIPSMLAEAGFWTAYLLAEFQPIFIWQSAGGWFTELGLNAILPWQETAATVLNLTVWMALVLLALRRFERKDLV